MLQQDSIETQFGNVHVRVQGVRGKPAIFTCHDIGLNSGFNADREAGATHKSTYGIQVQFFKDTGTKCETHFSFVMLNYFRTNQYEEP